MSLTPCTCTVTGHVVSCWNHPSGYYINGVKVAAFPETSIIVQASVPQASQTTSPWPLLVPVQRALLPLQ